jgi:hypothetical protein
MTRMQTHTMTIYTEAKINHTMAHNRPWNRSSGEFGAASRSIFKMRRNGVPSSPGDRFRDQLGAIVRLILASLYMVMVCVCTLQETLCWDNFSHRDKVHACMHTMAMVVLPALAGSNRCQGASHGSLREASAKFAARSNRTRMRCKQLDTMALPSMLPHWFFVTDDGLWSMTFLP